MFKITGQIKALFLMGVILASLIIFLSQTDELKTDLGIIGAGSDITLIPWEIDFLISTTPEMNIELRPEIKCILDWYRATPNDGSHLTPFLNRSDLEATEQNFRAVPSKWKYITFIGEERYRKHIQFNGLGTYMWFNSETLMGISTYRMENPGATELEWQTEMLVRMMRGFLDYFHDRDVQVGITMGGVTLTDPQNPDYYGMECLEYIFENFDFILFYIYTTNLNHFFSTPYGTMSYLEIIDEAMNIHPNFEPYWIVTARFRGWQIYARDRWDLWRRESLCLEVKRCMDRDISMCCYVSASDIEGGYTENFSTPAGYTTWQDLNRAAELYKKNEQYYEVSVYGRSLLTNRVGYTYGWVEAGI